MDLSLAKEEGLAIDKENSKILIAGISEREKENLMVLSTLSPMDSNDIHLGAPFTTSRISAKRCMLLYDKNGQIISLACFQPFYCWWICYYQIDSYGYVLYYARILFSAPSIFAWLTLL